VNATLNWFGTNNVTAALISGNVTFTPWLVLNISATPDNIYTGGNSTVAADLRHDSNGTLHNVTYLMDGIPVTWGSTFGTVDPVSGNTTNSTANTTFTAGNTPGTTNVSAAVDTQTVYTSIQIAALPTAAASPRGGNYYNNVTVNLTSSGGYDPVRIFFTTNGSIPTNASAVYAAPLNFVRTTILRFFAQDNLGTNSSVYSETYNVYRQVAYTYTVRVPVMRWVKRWYRSWYKSGGKWKFKWRSRWVSVPATIRVKRWYRSWYRSGGKWKFKWRSRWVRVPRTTIKHRTGQRWELS
jgi:hypothetical protein